MIDRFDVQIFPLISFGHADSDGKLVKKTHLVLVLVFEKILALP
jgi:hypothetical protein